MKVISFAFLLAEFVTGNTQTEMTHNLWLIDYESFSEKNVVEGLKGFSRGRGLFAPSRYYSFTKNANRKVTPASGGRTWSSGGRSLQQVMDQEGFFMYGKRNFGGIPTYGITNGFGKQGNFPGVSNLIDNIFATLPQEMINKQT